jgi:cell division protein FtsQ
MRDYSKATYHRATVNRNRPKKEKKPRRPLNVKLWLQRIGKGAAGLLVVAGIVAGTYGLYGMVSRMVLFRLERIEIVGTLKHLSRDEVIAMAGARTGDSILGIKLKRMGEILAKNPWVEQVKVRRYFPHTLTIAIVEREPVAILNMGYLYYLSNRGEIFKPLTAGDKLDYPVVTGLSEEEIARDPAASREALQEVLGLVSLLRKGTVIGLDDVSEIHYDRGNGFTLFALSGGVPVKLGHADFAAKLARLGRIYPELQAQQPALQLIDLDYADRIVIKRT